MTVERGLAELASSGLRASVFPLSLPFPSTVYSFPNSLLLSLLYLLCPLYALFPQTLYSKHPSTTPKWLIISTITGIRYSIYGHFSAIPILLQSYCITFLKVICHFRIESCFHAASIHSPRQLLLPSLSSPTASSIISSSTIIAHLPQCVLSNYNT